MTDTKETTKETPLEQKRTNLLLHHMGLVVVAVVLVLWGITIAFGYNADYERKVADKAMLERIDKGQKQQSEELKWHHVQVQFKHNEMMKELMSVNSRLKKLEAAVRKLEVADVTIAP